VYHTLKMNNDLKILIVDHCARFGLKQEDLAREIIVS